MHIVSIGIDLGETNFDRVAGEVAPPRLPQRRTWGVITSLAAQVCVQKLQTALHRTT